MNKKPPTSRRPRVGILASHPIQYQAPWFRNLARRVDLEVFFAYNPTDIEQGEGFGQAFTWDVDLLSGYSHRFLKNRAFRPGVSRFSASDTPDIRKHIREGRFDVFIVTGWYLKCYWQAVRACRRLKIPVLVRGDSQLGTPRSKLKQLAKEFVYRRMLTKFDGFLTVGLRNVEYLRHYDVPDEKLFSAPHFVDNDWFASQVTKAPECVAGVREQWGASDDDFTVVFAGKLIAKKRPADLLAAVGMLDPAVRCRLVYIGSGELEKSLRAQATELGVRANFVGFKNQSELPAHYAAADVLVLPSDGGETWGLVVNEAMACGTPAVVSEACGCAPDLIEAGATGFTFRTGDPAALADRLTHMAAMKRAGHDWNSALANMTRRFSVEACVSGTLDAVESVWSRRS